MKKNNKVYYADLFGKRKDKYDYLNDHSIFSTKFEELEYNKEYNFFVKKNFTAYRKYSSYYNITQIFKDCKSGVSTLRDHFVIDFTLNELKIKMDKFKSNLDDFTIKKELNLKDTRDWNLHVAREEFKKTEYSDRILDYSYRPFDTRLICYSPSLYDRGCSREEFMKNFYKPNVGIILRRSSTKTWHHIFITKDIMDMNFLEARTYVIPLWTYNDSNGTIQKTLNGKSIIKKSGKNSNLAEDFLKFISEQYPNKEINPEEVLGYIYVVLHSPIYREKYQEFLKIDFPRIPFVKDYKKFQKLSKLGSELIELHLMKKQFNRNIAKFEISGSNDVKYVKYKEKRIYLNEKQYFDNISEEIWNFHIGGYQVLDKWLKSKKIEK